MTLFHNGLSAYFAIAGAGMLIVSFVQFVRRAGLRLFGRRASGEIVGYAPRWKLHPGELQSFMPRVRFEGPDGVEREFQARTSADPSKWPPGARLPVVFQGDRPERALIATPLQLFGAPLGFAVLAAGLLIAAWRAGG